MGKWLNSIKGFIILFSVSFIILLLQYSCKPIVKSLGPFSSVNIEESKKAGAFLWDYYPLEVVFNDTLHLDIKEAFAEEQYSYNGYNDLRFNISKNCTQIVLIANDISKLGYSDSWRLEAFDSWTIEASDCHDNHYGFVRYFNKVNPPDILIVNIIKVDVGIDGGSGTEDGKVIGAFRLRRKPGKLSDLAIPK